MDIQAMYMYLVILATSLLINVSIATGIKEDHMFVYHDVVIVESSTTFDRNTRTRLGCASLCMQNEDCVALSYQNRTCRIQTNGNMSVIPNVRAVTMTYSKGLTLQQYFMVTNSPLNQTAVFGQDGTSQTWSLSSTETTNDQPFTTMEFKSVDDSSVYSWSNTSPPAESTTAHNNLTTDLLSATTTTRNHVTTKTSSARVTTRDHVTMDTRSMGTTTVKDVIKDQSSTEATTDAYVTSYKSSMKSTTHNFVTTVTSAKTIKPSSADMSSNNYVNTGATSRGHVTNNAITTDTSTATSSIETPENKDPTTEQEPSLSTSQPDTTTNVNSWPGTSNYIFINIESTMMEAEIVCNSIGGKLLEINNATKEQYLKDNNIVNVAGMSPFWIGAYDANGDGNYEWLSNPSVQMTYTTWNIQEPRRIGSYLCLVSANQWQLAWGSSQCTDLRPFFCEKLS